MVEVKKKITNIKNTDSLPLVSVVVPIYNVKKFLKDCFSSIVTQTYKNLEIILVDDGSTDESGDLADELASTDNRAVVIHKENGGLSSARNAGIKKATGEFITFIDSDDIIHNEFVEVLIRNLLLYNADVAQCNNSRNRSHLGTSNRSISVLTGEEAFVKMMNYKIISPTAWAKIYRKDLFDNKSLLFAVGRMHEDTASLYKIIYQAKKIVVVPDVMYWYRYNANSIMNANYTKRHYESVYKYFNELDKFIEKNRINIDPKLVKRHKMMRMASIIDKMAIRHMDQEPDFKEAKRLFYVYSKGQRDITSLLLDTAIRHPVLFRFFKKITPAIRRIIGKE